jgi:hypothetical protein
MSAKLKTLPIGSYPIFLSMNFMNFVNFAFKSSTYEALKIAEFMNQA